MARIHSRSRSSSWRQFSQHACLLMLFPILLASTRASGETIGVPEDHLTIQAAIDAAKPGDLVVVSPGSYPERLRLSRGVTVRSRGADRAADLGLERAKQTIIDAGGRGDDPGVTMAEGAVLDGFTVTGIGSYDEAEWKLHHASQGEKQSHDEIGASGIPAIRILGVDCVVTNNIVHHNGSSGIVIVGKEDGRTSPQISSNICYRNMGGGIASTMGSSAIVTENICFQNLYAGIGQHGASPFLFDNECYENIRAGIGIGPDAQPTLRGNRCYRNRRAGIGIRSGDKTRPVIEGNSCYENDMAGIGVRDKSRPLLVSNRCFRNKLAGIGCRAGARPVIVGNECYENELAGIGQRGDAATVVIENVCRDNKASGIGFETCESGSSIVVGNRLLENKLVAVGIHSGWKVRLSGNEMSRTGGMPPMVMIFQGAEAELSGNFISGSGVAGVRVGGKVRAIDNRIVGKALRKGGPPNFAFWALPGSDIVAAGNTISGWRHAISADGADVSAVDNRISKYWNVGMRIHRAPSTVTAVGNVFESDLKHAGLSITESETAKLGNRVIHSKAENSSSE